MPVELTFTAVPNRVDSARNRRLSVVVGIRLTGGSTLSAFPDIESWPAFVSGLAWEVVGEGAGEPVALPVAVTDSVLDSDLWADVFPPGTPVRDATGLGYTDHDVLSYPVGHLADHLTGLLLDAAVADPTAPPLLDGLRADEGFTALSTVPPSRGGRTPDSRELDLAERRRRTDRDNLGRSFRSIPPAPEPDPEFDMAQLALFHKPTAYDRDLGAPPIAAPSLDFHQVLSSLMPHPQLLRRLGLIIDLAVPVSLVDATTVRVRATAGAAEVDARTPRTALDAGPFRPLPRDPAEGDGVLLPLDDATRYRIVTQDVTGAALRYRDFATSVVLGAQSPSPAEPRRRALPRLRSDGLQLVRTGAATALVRKMDRMADIGAALAGSDTATGDVLFAEDLRRGFRVDVQDGLIWRSLHQRTTAVTVRGELALTIEGEGVITTAASKKPLSDLPQLHLSETTAQWRGWSLSVPRPGTPLAAVGEGLGTDAPSEPSPAFPVTFAHSVLPGSLPVLRFGRTYRLRGRVVDIVGGGMGPETPAVEIGGDGAPPPEAGVSPPVVYRRWEPVAPPALLPTALRDEGGSLTRIVLRSDFDQDPGEADPRLPFTYPETAQRWVAAPKAAPDLVEAHGVLDVGGRPSAAAHDVLTARADAVLGDQEGAARDPGNYYRPYLPPEAGPLVVGYLPDPLAIAVAIRGLPGRDEPLLLDLRGVEGWPVTRPLRLVVVQGPLGFDVGESADEVEIRIGLPKAARLPLQLASALVASPGDAVPDQPPLSLLAVWQGVLDRRGGDVDPVPAATGAWWSLTPSVQLDLLHAVRRPLLQPTLTLVSVTRQPGSTVANLSSSIDHDRPSTGRLDLHASWIDPVDTGAGQGAPAADPTPLSSAVGADQPPASTAEIQVPLPFLVRTDVAHDFGDTRARRVTYTPEATSAFTENFVSRQQVALAPDERTIVVPGGFIAGSDAIHAVVSEPPDGASPATPGIRYERGRDYLAFPEDGAIVRLAGGRIPDAPVDVEYLQGPVSRVGEPTPPAVVPASVRPPAPVVRGTLPAARWTRDGLQSSREGGWVRVWLDRPWFTTGAGERLAVVCARTEDQAATPDSPVSRWGADPTSTAAGPEGGFPRWTAFPQRVDAATPAVLPGGEEVDIAVHDVHFSTTRKLWFADIRIDPGASSNQPFVRLVVARWQGDALTAPEDLRLSQPVVLDQIRLQADRSVQVVPLEDGRLRVTLFGDGQPADSSATSTARAWVESRDLASPAEDPASWRPLPGLTLTSVLLPVDAAGRRSRVGTLRRPDLAFRGALRVVVEEEERHPTGPEGGGAADREPWVIYSDTVDL